MHLLCYRQDIEIAKKSYQDEVVRLQTQRSKRYVSAYTPPPSEAALHRCWISPALDFPADCTCDGSGPGPACGREIQAERSLRDVLKRLGEAGDTLRKEESDLEEATRQYLQLICDSQVGSRATRGHWAMMTPARFIRSCRYDSG